MHIKPNLQEEVSHVQTQLVEVAKSRSDDAARRDDMRVWALQEEIRVKEENLRQMAEENRAKDQDFRLQAEKIKELTDKWDQNVEVRVYFKSLFEKLLKGFKLPIFQCLQ